MQLGKNTKKVNINVTYLVITYLEHTDELLEKLKGLVEVLSDCEQEFIKKIDDKVIAQYINFKWSNL